MSAPPTHRIAFPAPRNLVRDEEEERLLLASSTMISNEKKHTLTQTSGEFSLESPEEGFVEFGYAIMILNELIMFIVAFLPYFPV